jgi:26S proteasome regulatory subunit N7
MDYKKFVTLTVLASIISLERVDLKKKVVNGAEILEVLHQLPVIKQFMLSFYHCHYAEFFKALGRDGYRRVYN